MRPVREVAASGAVSGPARGVEVMRRRGDKAYDQVASAIIVTREHQGRTAFGAGKVCEWKAGKDNAAKGEHLACSLYQASVGVGLRLVWKPIEGAPA